MHIGKGLAVSMARNNRMSQAALAAAVGVTRPYVCSLCNDERVPSLGLLEKIAEALNCKVWEIIKECEE